MARPRGYPPGTSLRRYRDATPARSGRIGNLVAQLLQDRHHCRKRHVRNCQQERACWIPHHSDQVRDRGPVLRSASPSEPASLPAQQVHGDPHEEYCRKRFASAKSDRLRAGLRPDGSIELFLDFVERFHYFLGILCCLSGYVAVRNL